MGELTIGQKAKLYDEAIERAEKWRNAPNVDKIPPFVDRIIDDIFPEFKESEDERIRKELIAFLKENLETGRADETWSMSGLERWIAWLEKQGNTNKFITKDEFTHGVLRGAAINLITWIDNNAAKGNMCLSNMECKDIEDALISCNWDKIYTYIKKKLEKRMTDKEKIREYLVGMANAACCNKQTAKDIKEIIIPYIDSMKKELTSIGEASKKPKFKIGDKIQYNKYTYTIKEVQEDCYVLDNDKVLTFNAQDVWELYEQKPAWSEEDERLFQIIIDILDKEEHKGHLSHTDLIACVRKLKSLKEKVQPQNRWKPSDEQMKAIEFMVRSFGESGTLSPYGGTMAYATSLLNDLKKL